MKFMFWTNFLLCCILQYILSKGLTDNNTDPTSICDTAKRTYRSAGYQEEDIYTLKRTENNLKVCGQDSTCCKTQAELNLVKLSEQRRTALADPLEKQLNGTFHHTGNELKDLLREMINVSHENFETWFQKTYGLHYEKNRHVFGNLYNTFQRYLNGSELDLQMEINAFFAKLHEKIYVMTKPFSKFSQKYENCIFESTNYVKPFGIIQEKVQRQTYHSFLASRVFLQGLKEGMEVVTQLLRLPVHDRCSVAYMKMTQCSICSSVSETMKPCVNYCNNVMKGCFAFITLVQPKWNEYVKEMVALAEKLEGPFSLEAVVESLAVKISEAIMIFQDNSGNVTLKVEEKCGKTPSSNNLTKRNRRSATDEGLKKTLTDLKTESEELVKEFNDETEKVLENLKQQTSSNTTETNIDSIEHVSFKFNSDKRKKKQSKIELLLSNTKVALNNLLDYWMLLPANLCAMGKSAENNTDCWNGIDTSGYNKSIVGNSVHDLFSRNPEMDSLDPDVPDVNIVNHAKKLEVMIEKIKNTINGNPVVCVDCTGETDEESGSGSGEGSTDNGSAGSGYTTTKSTTVDPCDNSVDNNCRHSVRTTKSPNELENEIDFRGPNVLGPVNFQTKSSSTYLTANILLLYVTVLVVML